ncbi:cysteine-rich CWC family protein [Paraglaciecola hydrolytica]|uniref:cysteine-rich CWC family protein n=1 Tax=Paraglaciecola hydrolytica TaxID=1799789 RepID=UPI0009E79137
MNTSQVCPFCQQSNQCGENNASGCWCIRQAVPAELLSLLPESAKNVVCICATCIATFAQNPQDFAQRISETSLGTRN